MSTVKYKPEIAIIIPTFKRDDLLMDCIHSILDHWQNNWKIFIVDQNPLDDDSFEKKLFYATACADVHTHENRQIEVIRVEPDSGLNYTLNWAIFRAKAQNIPYCLVSADSIHFNASLEGLNLAVEALTTPKWGIDLLGLDLEGYPAKIEAFLTLVHGSHFQTDLIDPTGEPDHEIVGFRADPVNPMFEHPVSELAVFKCDITKNFFIAKTEALSSIGWDVNFKFGGNIDFFYRFKLGHFKCGFTPSLKGIHVKTGTSEFDNMREENLKRTNTLLRQKYNLTNGGQT